MDEMVIKGGTIVTASGQYKADLRIEHGVITQIAKEIESQGEVIDAHGKFVLPGAVDVHTHLELPFNGTTSADDYKDGTIAAACGGTTMVFNYLNQVKGKTLQEKFNADNESASKKACIDYSFHFGITKWDEQTRLQMKQAMENGVTSFKCYTTYREDNMMLDEAEICEILEYGKEIGALICVHAENNALLEHRRKKFVEEGKLSPWYHYLSRDEMVEAQSDKALIDFAKHVDAPLYIVHLADKEGLEAAKEARAQGYQIVLETCPQYLEFNSEVYKREDAAKFVCSPPMKNEDNRLAIRKGVTDGFIDVVATDHCPFTLEQKALGKDNFTKIPNGCMGVENRYPYLLGMAMEGEMTLSEVVRICCHNPAKLFGCDTKGDIEIGKDADVVIFDPKGSMTVTAEKMHTKAEYTIWEGITTKGKIEMTISKGKVIAQNGEFIGNAGDGKFIACKKSSLFTEKRCY